MEKDLASDGSFVQVHGVHLRGPILGVGGFRGEGTVIKSLRRISKERTTKDIPLKEKLRSEVSPGVVGKCNHPKKEGGYDSSEHAKIQTILREFPRVAFEGGHSVNGTGKDPQENRQACLGKKKPHTNI